MTARDRASANNGDVIEILDPNLRLGFAQMPRPVLRARGLSRNAKTLYALLLDYAWQDGACFPGQARLAGDLDISVDTLKRDLDELRHFGLLSWKQRGMNQTNVYYILPLNECAKLDLSPKPRKFEMESADLPVPDSADLRNPESASLRSQESASLRSQESAKLRRQESANSRSKRDAARLDIENNTQPTTRRTRAATASSPVVVVQTPLKEQENPLISQLTAAGMTDSTAHQLCSSYPAERISQQLAVLDYLRMHRPGEVKEPAAWLRSAIVGDWAAPRGFKAASQREADEAARLARYAEQATMYDLFSLPTAPTQPYPEMGEGATPPAQPAPNMGEGAETAAEAWADTISRLRLYLSSERIELLRRARLLPYLPGQRVARVAVASQFERSRLLSLERHHVELALSDVLGETVNVEFVLG